MKISCITWITRIVKTRVATGRVTGMTVVAGMMVTGMTVMAGMMVTGVTGIIIGMTRMTFIAGSTGKIWLTGMV